MFVFVPYTTHKNSIVLVRVCVYECLHSQMYLWNIVFWVYSRFGMSIGVYYYNTHVLYNIQYTLPRFIVGHVLNNIQQLYNHSKSSMHSRALCFIWFYFALMCVCMRAFLDLCVCCSSVRENMRKHNYKSKTMMIKNICAHLLWRLIVLADHNGCV